MQRHKVDDTVRLIRSVPELYLGSGSVGVVQNVCLAPAGAYEVEFHVPDLALPIRALLLAEYLESAGQSAPADVDAATANNMGVR